MLINLPCPWLTPPPPPQILATLSHHTSVKPSPSCNKNTITAQHQGLQHQIVGEGWITFYELYTDLRQHNTPKYGLDFTMEYTLNSGETKVN